MDTSSEIQFIVETFKAVKHAQQKRYKVGLTVRQTILNNQRIGVETENYRIDFLKESIFKLFKFIEEMGLEFNQSHPEDYFTSADIADILVNAINILENKVQN